MSNSQKRRQNQGTQWRPDSPPQRALAAPPADGQDTPDGMTPEDRLQAEVLAEAEANDDGSVIVQLVTADGKADIRVPRLGLWRSSARSAVFMGYNDAHWAVLTLSRDDAAMWLALDPTLDDVKAFFIRWQQATGQDLGESGASRTS